PRKSMKQIRPKLWSPLTAFILIAIPTALLLISTGLTPTTGALGAWSLVILLSCTVWRAQEHRAIRKRMRTLRDVTHVLAPGSDLGATWQMALRLAAGVAGSDVACMRVLDDEGRLVLTTSRGLSQAFERSLGPVPADPETVKELRLGPRSTLGAPGVDARLW